jgi:alpha-tubulin suppressor-like RCC1 family protein
MLGVGGWDTTVQVNYPVAIPNLDSVSSVAIGIRASYALRTDGTVWAWGQNGYCQLGDGTTANSPYPVQVSGLTDVVQIDAGYEYGMALKSDGSVWVWGNYTVLTHRGSKLACVPEQVADVSAVSIAAGFETGYALQADGTVLAWGDNTYGDLGIGTNETSESRLPVQVPITDVVSISGGNCAGFAVRNDGTVWSWGRNSRGQLGDGTNTDAFLPTQVIGMQDAIAVAAGGFAVFALDSSGDVWSWGGAGGELYTDWDNPEAWVPFQVTGLSNITAVSAAINSSDVIAIQGPS